MTVDKMSVDEMTYSHLWVVLSLAPCAV